MLHLGQFRDLILERALRAIDLRSEAAVELLLGTALQESRLTYIKQLGNGPALGLFQMEPDTHDDIWEHFLKYRPDLAARVSQLSPTQTPNALVGNLWYAAAMCRVHYLRAPDPLPEAGDLAGQAKYYKRYYNTPLGAATEEEYISNYRKFVNA